MAAPVWLNVGTRNNSAGATSLVPALPASRANGNILIAVCASKNNATHSVSGSGWVALGTQTNSGTGWTVSLWRLVVNGSEGAPTISWTGSVAAFAQIIQYTRANFDTASPFGTIGTPGAGTTSTHTSTGFNSTRNNSLITYIDAAAANTAIAQPSSWTERYDAGSATGATRNAGGTRAITTSGSSSGNISVTGAAAAWVQWQIEILEPRLAGSFAPSESGSDTAALAGDVIVQGPFAATESGADTASLSGDVFVSGVIAVNEAGADTAALAGAVANSAITGTLAATDAGADTAALAGLVLVQGTLAVNEAGNDTAAASGLVLVQGTLGASEAGDDTASIDGTVTGGAVDTITQGKRPRGRTVRFPDELAPEVTEAPQAAHVAPVAPVVAIAGIPALVARVDAAKAEIARLDAEAATKAAHRKAAKVIGAEYRAALAELAEARQREAAIMRLVEEDEIMFLLAA
jgi:uncharacterized small protein (DUF1192 family)